MAGPLYDPATRMLHFVDILENKVRNLGLGTFLDCFIAIFDTRFITSTLIILNLLPKNSLSL